MLSIFYHRLWVSCLFFGMFSLYLYSLCCMDVTNKEANIVLTCFIVQAWLAGIIVSYVSSLWLYSIIKGSWSSLIVFTIFTGDYVQVTKGQWKQSECDLPHNRWFIMSSYSKSQTPIKLSLFNAGFWPQSWCGLFFCWWSDWKWRDCYDQCMKNILKWAC